MQNNLNRKIIVREFDTTIDYIDSYYKDESTFIKLFFKEESTVEILDNGNIVKFRVAKKDHSVVLNKIK